MVTFKRLFQADRYPSATAGGQDVGLSSTDSESTTTTRPTPSPQPSAKTGLSGNAYVDANRSTDVERHFQRIEKQLEELHDSLQARPHPVHIPSRTSSRFATRNPRHVDLFDAVFTSPSKRHPVQPQAETQTQTQPQTHSFHRKQRQQPPSKNVENHSPSSASPLDPYNEDVAERNMAPVLSKPSRKRNLYTRLVSALSQEDVTERNLAPTKGKESIVRPRSRSTRSVHSTKSPLSPLNGQKGSKGAAGNSSKESKPVTGLVPREAATRPRSRAGTNEPATAGPQDTQQPPAIPRLRSQRSAPNLSTLSKVSPPMPSLKPLDRSPDPGPVGHLSVPPAHKQGNTWNTTPLPDSPTLPGQTGTAEKQQQQQQQEGRRSTTEAPVSPPVPSPTSPPARRASSSLASASPSKPPSRPPRPAPARKNTLNLSINTHVAATGAGKKAAKSSSRAIQPPTPNSKNDTKCNPSIAEVMNSPICASSPISAVSPVGLSNQKVAEIMDMFKQAYKSTESLTPHPTFETLQDAIVREINSHEAFARVPVPEPGPAFTPSPTRQYFDRRESAPAKPRKSSSISMPGGISGKEQLAKLKPFKKHRRNSEVSRSISTSVVPSVVNCLAATPERSRRHTDAPPPSPGFLDEPVEEMSDEEPVSPTTIPARCQTVPPGAVAVSSTTETSNITKSPIPTPAFSTTNTTFKSPPSSIRKASITLDTAAAAATVATGSVYCMRAQSSPISSDGKTSFSVGSSSNNSSLAVNEDVVHLPTPSPSTAYYTPQSSTRKLKDPFSEPTGSASAVSTTTPASGKSRWSIFPPAQAAVSAGPSALPSVPSSRSPSVAQQ